MEKKLDFKVAGDIELQIGDHMYYDENGKSAFPQYTLEKVYKNVEGDVRFTLEEDTPYAEILLRVKGLPGNCKLKELTKDGRVIFNGGSIEPVTKELGCDSASYDINGFEVRTGSDGSYGQVIELYIDKMFAGVYVELCGPILMGATKEELHATIFAALEEWIVTDDQKGTFDSEL